ncbi:DUF4365 domain-containing protein [Dyella nitratireducens]|uniref:DUF4365 domain-containing protein n=1 Tax=Dyella nitratireducens TaxID=1849580 RepID=A0ABQ1FS85_9GAMM|nr:DUF4365 domain-containing protein [Dyella nitratireducens]GGA29067.1 hypothetical protein GCM10010981_17400 [Dyella nitratireducens]GLQ43195.1 hypothetical protein GCM10007902_30450 [Dyella nitratireducens]
MSKQYPKRSINGDAGEHFASFKFTRVLGWPCRLQDVDIGIDAEIEIVEEGGATGNVVKLQIKSFDHITATGKHDVYVDEADIAYWRKFSVPTIVVCVDLTKQKVYWKPIHATESYATGGKSYKISFDLVKDELVLASKDALAQLSSPDQFKDVVEFIAQAKAIHDRVTASAAYAIDDEDLDKIYEEKRDFDSIVVRIDEVRRHYPWRISEFSGRELDRMKSSMWRHLNDAEVSYNNGVNGM